VMYHLKNHPQVNQVRFAIVFIFCVILMMSYHNSAKQRAKMEVQKEQRLATQKEKDRKLQEENARNKDLLNAETKGNKRNRDFSRRESIKTKRPLTVYDSPTSSSVLSTLPRGESLTLIATTYDKRWTQVKHGVILAWVKTRDLQE